MSTKQFFDLFKAEDIQELLGYLERTNLIPIEIRSLDSDTRQEYSYIEIEELETENRYLLVF